MTRKGLIFWYIALLLIAVLTIPYAVYLLKILFAGSNVLGQLEIFKWMGVGVLAFLLIRKFVKGNLDFLEVFSHELTHAFFALIFNRQVLELHATREGGVIWSAGRTNFLSVPVSLSPYCFPMFTFILLSVRWMMDFHGTWIFDIFIGITLGFHFFCFKNQIGNHQTDINQYPILFSYFYISLSWLLVFCIVVPSFFPNMNGHGTAAPLYNYGVFSSIWRLMQEWWNNFLYYLQFIKI